MAGKALPTEEGVIHGTRRSGIAAIALIAAMMPHPGDAAGPGAAQFKKSCGTCHSTEPSSGARQGPNLHGVFGRAAGRASGFAYSPAFQAASRNITWDAQTLDKWLTDPQQVIPGTVMLYRQGDAEKRRLVIDFLKSQ
jgi:cytochrome c